MVHPRYSGHDLLIEAQAWYDEHCPRQSWIFEYVAEAAGKSLLQLTKSCEHVRGDGRFDVGDRGIKAWR
jgi:hypothetical protein